MDHNDSNQRRSDDGGTVLEPIRALYAAHSMSAPAPQARSRGQTAIEPVAAAVPRPRPPGTPRHVAPASYPAGVVEEPFRPSMRPATPRVTICDDGDMANGEVVRLREQTTVIGRCEGTIRLPHDPLVSLRHAEIVREGEGVPQRWILRDLGSSNGTFVCCVRTVLRPDRLIILGSRRYRLQMPAAAAPTAQTYGTVMIDGRQLAEHLWPCLVETTQMGGKATLMLKSTDLKVGRPGHGNQIEIDDPLLAAHHATIRRDSNGEWWIEAKPSLNGLWAQINAIRLSDICRFQCGEQRFLFVV